MTKVTADSPVPPSVDVQQASDGAVTVVLHGAWTLRGFARGLPGVRARLRRLARGPEIGWDLRFVDALDRAGALWLWRTWGERRPRRLLAHPRHEALFDGWRSAEAAPPAPPRRRLRGLIQLAPRQASALIDHALAGVALLGQIALDAGYLVRHPSRMPWREISATIYRAGAQALFITALVGSLVGVVISYLSALNLEAYGAQNYIIDVLGLSIIRELGPLVAAILVAGRSGSAMTAELGVMRVTQELDALAALGISPTVRLVLPKVVALTIALPLLIVWTDAVALLGGMIAARFTVGMSVWQFLMGLPGAVPIVNFWIGIGKGVVFGAAIALTACHFGLRIRPDARSLAAETTNSVVTAITLLIVVDAVFAILFQGVGTP